MRLLIPLLICVAARAEDAAPRILNHEIVLTIDPATGGFESVDTMRVEGPGTPVLPALEDVVATAERSGDTVVARFKGRIRNPVQRSNAATWVAGDSTAGTISAEGSYLVRGFYVEGPGTCPFRTTIRVPLPHRAVTIGKLVSEKVGEVTYETGYAVDGIVVVTGPWVVDEREIDGVSCRTYLYEGDRGYAGLLLDSLSAEIPRFQKLFGPVPDRRFDVVENFFATGYGFSNFTLLGDTVIRYVSRKSKGVLPAGYVDHELVHCWLGNYLHVDYERGNWCEALTTYFTNYGASQREGRDAAYRRKVSLTYSLRVGEKNDYPLRAFKSKRHDFENDIGYGKGSMVFHMLARRIGRDELVAGVRRAIAEKGGTKLGWEDLVASLGGDDLKAWFAPWLDRIGAPILELGAVRAPAPPKPSKGKEKEATAAVHRVVGTIRQKQDGDAYDLTVPLRVTTAAGVEEHVVECASKETAFSLTTRAAPQRIELDPDHHVFRRIPREFVAPCMEAVLRSENRVGFGHEGLLARLKIPAAQPGLPKDAAVLAVGLGADPAVRSALLAGARRQEPTFMVTEGAFTFRGKTYDQAGDSILISFARPDAPGLPVTLYHGNSDAAMARAMYLPYYASHGWVVFRNGAPIDRGEFEGDRPNRRSIREGAADALVQDLLRITDPAHKGRAAGTTESYKLANQLRGRLHQTGAKVIPWPSVAIRDGSCSKERRITLLNGEQKEHLDGAFHPFHGSASPDRPAVFERVVVHPADDPKGALVILPEDTPFALAKEYADKGAAVVAVLATSGKRAAEAAWEGAMPEGVKGSVRSLMARTGSAALRVPYLYLAPDAAALLRQRAKPGVTGVVRFTLRRTLIATANIVGVFGEGRRPGVLLSAHWDGVGVVDGKVTQGAADNAAGVAVVLWVADRLRLDHEAGRLKLPVVVALFGGEEQGLWGSRQFADAVRNPQSPIAKPVAAVNVDGIGSGKPGQVYLIGRSHYPELLASFQRALKGLPLELGRDIDKFAYRLGSDHWPLHEAGIPAVTVYNADYRSMNSPRDTLARVDVSLVRETAKAIYRTVRELATK